MVNTPLIVSHDLGEFFRQELTSAKSVLGIDLSELSLQYLVNLLCEFSRHSNRPELGEEPLALQYKNALESAPGERAQRLKDLGDESLYVAGFFSEFIERSLVNVRYYISMGGNAYGSLSGLMGSHRRGSAFAALYEQLAVSFPRLVDLLNQVSDRARARTDGSELLQLYARWLRTGSTSVQRVLHERGLYVRDGFPHDFED